MRSSSFRAESFLLSGKMPTFQGSHALDSSFGSTERRERTAATATYGALGAGRLTKSHVCVMTTKPRNLSAVKWG